MIDEERLAELRERITRTENLIAECEARMAAHSPKFDNPKMDDCAALQLFGAGREKRIYAIPPHTRVVSLDFEDHPFERYRLDGTCALCGANDSYLDEVITDDRGGRMFVCSDTDYCETRQTQGHRGSESAAPHKERPHG